MTRPGVLIINDDANATSAARLVLQEGGYDVVETRDSRAAFDVLGQRRYAAIVVDLHLPGMTGIELVRRIRTESSSATIPVIVLTTDSTVGDRIRGLAAGATDDDAVAPEVTDRSEPPGR